MNSAVGWPLFFSTSKAAVQCAAIHIFACWSGFGFGWGELWVWRRHVGFSWVWRGFFHINLLGTFLLRGLFVRNLATGFNRCLSWAVRVHPKRSSEYKGVRFSVWLCYWQLQHFLCHTLQSHLWDIAQLCDCWTSWTLSGMHVFIQDEKAKISSKCFSRQFLSWGLTVNRTN